MELEVAIEVGEELGKQIADVLCEVREASGVVGQPGMHLAELDRPGWSFRRRPRQKTSAGRSREDTDFRPEFRRRPRGPWTPCPRFRPAYNARCPACRCGLPCRPAASEGRGPFRQRHARRTSPEL